MEETSKTAIDNPCENTMEITAGTEPLNIYKASDNEASSPEEKLILGKFKTVEDLIHAYSSSEKLITKTRQELKRMREGSEKPQPEQDMLNNEADHVLPPTKEESLEELKNRILMEKAENSPPPLISKSGGEMMQAPIKKPSSFEEAGEAFLNYLNTLN